MEVNLLSEVLETRFLSTNNTSLPQVGIYATNAFNLRRRGSHVNHYSQAIERRVDLVLEICSSVLEEHMT